MNDVQEYIGRGLERFTEEILDFLRIPSVSAKSEHNQDTRDAAQWLRMRLEEAGLEAEVKEMLASCEVSLYKGTRTRLL